jgi:hypothetical protein
MGGAMGPGDTGALATGEEIEIAGMGFVDLVQTAGPIIRFQDALKASPLFSDETRIVSQPKPPLGAVTRSFVIRIVLEESDEEI